MAGPVIRRATLDDVPAIVALLADDVLGRAREVSATPLDPRYAGAFAAIDTDPNQLLMVMERNGTVVGCCQITVIPGLSNIGRWLGQIEGVRIAASERGKGLGEILIRWAIDECRRRGCGAVQLTTDKRRTGAHRFYERLGFVASHEGMKLALA